MKKQRVVIVGGGFGGIKAALELSREQAERCDVTLVSDQDSFRYYPALYRTATGGPVAGSHIALSEILNDKPVKVVLASATDLDRATRRLILADGTSLDYDVLVLGLGVVTNYFGIPGMEQYSYGIKSYETIERFKAHLHEQLEDDRRPDLKYVIVGAGPTGIELAGALPEYLQRIMRYHGLKPKPVHIDLIEAGPRLLPRMPKPISKAVTRRLRALGIKLHIKQAVQGIAADQLTVNGKPIRSHTVIWTAGTTNHPFFKNNGFMLTPRGKVATDLYLQAEDNIYVIGDNANTPYSGMAQTALYDGIYVADTIGRRVRGQEPRSYKVKKPITVIPVGEHWASVLWGNVKLYGVIGWVLRELADILAFADYEPWWKAGKQWLTGLHEEETCAVCVQAMKREMVDN